MGYFNYFIKCIIRNITYRLCTPKVFLTVLFCVLLLFILHNKGYCADGDDGISDVVTTSPTDSFGNGYIQYDNQFLTLRELQESTQRDVIMKLYSLYSSNPGSTTVFLKRMLFELTASTDGKTKGIYVQSGLSNNQFAISVFFNDDLTLNTSLGVYTYSKGGYTFVNVPYNSGYFYTYYIANDNSITTSSVANYYSVPVPFIGVFVPEWIQLFKDVGLISSSETQSLLELKTQNSLINEQNQLQQQQNQIQQEQNDILTNDEVDTGNLQFATDDTVNPTEEGFNTLFTSIYNAFCNTSSAPLKVTLPFVNQSFTISPNLVSNAMQKCGLGVVVTLIQSYYYYGVCLFIYKDINKIIEHLKSGNLTAVSSKISRF